MSRQSRSLLFYFLVLVFIVVGTTAVFYSKGWRFNWQDLSFQQTGAIFIKSDPRSLALYINDKLRPEQGRLLLSGTLLKNLVPGEYKLRLEKEGFLPWENKVEVEEEIVAEFKNVILIPEKITAKTIATDTIDIVIKDENKIIRQAETGRWFYKNKKIPGSQPIDWVGENKVLSQDSSSGNWLIFDINEEATSNLTLIFRNLQSRHFSTPDRSEIKNISTSRAGQENILITTGGALYKVNTDTLAIEKLSAKPYIKLDGYNSTDLLVSGSRLAKLSSNGQFDLVYDLATTTIGQIKADRNEVAIEDEDQNLWLLPYNGEIKLVAEGAKLWDMDEDGRVIFSDAGGIKIYYKESGQIKKTELDTVGLNWLAWAADGNHWIMSKGDQLRIIEVVAEKTGAEKTVLYNEVIANNVSEAIWNKGEKSLWWLTKDDILYQDDYLIKHW